MKKLLTVLGVTVAALITLGNPAGATSSYDLEWSQPMNSPAYWTDLGTCTKYDGHGGWIPAEYDAAIIKGGTAVRVYPDLDDVGAFQAVGPTNPNTGQPYGISWVMKCTRTTSTTTTTTTTIPETTTTTTIPEQTTTTTIPEEETTTTTEAPPTTTEPCSTYVPSPECTPSTPPPTVETGPPPTPPAPPATPPAGAPPTLPETGSSSTTLALLALAFIAGGTVLVARARRA